MKSAPEFSINPLDFKTAEIRIDFENTTSRSEKLAPGLVSLQETEEKSVVLKVPATACALNHNAVLELTRIDPARPNEPLQFRATIKITELEKTDDPNVNRVRAKLLQFDEATWSRFLEEQGSRQDAINRFLRSAQG